MAKCPFANWKPLPENSTQAKIIPIGIIDHSAAGTSNSLWAFFNSAGENLESHFYVRNDGVIEQYIDTEVQSDANRKANAFIGSDGKRYGYVSIETQNNSPSFDTDIWLPIQAASMKRLHDWLANTHNIPRRACRNSKDPGLGYHTMWGAPSDWTPVSKSCPGVRRVKQWKEEILPAFTTGTGPVIPPDTTGDILDMDETKLRQIISEEVAKVSTTQGYDGANIDSIVARHVNEAIEKLLSDPEARLLFKSVTDRLDKLAK